MTIKGLRTLREVSLPFKSSVFSVFDLDSLYQCASVSICGFILGYAGRQTSLPLLGSNLGDRAANLERAIGLCPKQVCRFFADPRCMIPSRWIFARSRGLNCVVKDKRRLLPRQLLHALQGIERMFGSIKSIPRAHASSISISFSTARALFRTPEIEIPHPRMAGRRFVLVPLAELAPSCITPLSAQPLPNCLPPRRTTASFAYGGRR